MNTYERWGKRLLDTVGAGFAVAALSPLLAFTALAVRLTSKGPAIFRHERVGAEGESFTLLKFRSMPVNTALVTSDRAVELKVTSVGRVLRRTNVDELPQLFNILRGEMSLVGPRPALPSQVDLLAGRSTQGAARLRPGLTGLAQVNSFDGMTPHEKAQWDERYASRVSLANDLRIMWATLGYLTKPPPTY